MANKGTVELEYSWQVMMETFGKTVSFNHGGKLLVCSSTETHLFAQNLNLLLLFLICHMPIKLKIT